MGRDLPHDLWRFCFLVRVCKGNLRTRGILVGKDSGRESYWNERISDGCETPEEFCLIKPEAAQMFWDRSLIVGTSAGCRDSTAEMRRSDGVKAACVALRDSALFHESDAEPVSRLAVRFDSGSIFGTR